MGGMGFPTIDDVRRRTATDTPQADPATPKAAGPDFDSLVAQVKAPTLDYGRT